MPRPLALPHDLGLPIAMINMVCNAPSPLQRGPEESDVSSSNYSRDNRIQALNKKRQDQTATL
jgi:hypothetical protein